MAFFYIFTAITVLIVTKALKGFLLRRASKIPSASMGWPIVGESISFMKPHPAFTLGDYLEHRIQKYGKIFWANIYGKWLIHSVDPELNRFVVNNEMKLFEQGWPRFFTKIVGKHGLTLSLGDDHKRYRGEIVNYMNGSQLEMTFLRDMELIAAAHMESWKDKPTIMATEETRKYAFYLIAKKAMSVVPGAPETEKLMEALKNVYTGLGAFPLNLPGTPYNKALKSRAYLQKVIRRTMEERRQKIDENNNPEEDDFLGYLMKKPSYSNQEVADQVQNFMFGGNEVIGRTLAAAIYYLEGCPKARSQLREERVGVLRVKQQTQDCYLTVNDYKSMEFTQCVVNEVLRLGNVSRFLNKTSTADIQFKGYMIPRGSTVIANISAMHLDPSEFEDPEKFNPWRWQTPSGVKRSKYFMPFSGGARYCIGSELAKLELMVFIHQLLMSYEWESIEPDPPMATPRLIFTKGLPIKLRPIQS